ncbi:MAG: mechanosensitive ion channel protein [Kiritimatiellaceae bacterium TMED266]|nr:MAG: mechanosensitive ion channel protein [Kiritimatiellaceae bacterium TMED266]
MPSSDRWGDIGDQLRLIAVDYGVQIIGALLVLIFGMWIAKGLRRLFVKLMERHEMDGTLVNFLAGVVYVILQIVVIIAALETLDVKTASLLALIGTAGLAVGLALQGSLSNFAAGVMLIIFRPFKVGDYIDAGGGAGTVEEIGIFTTIVNSLDNKRIIIPNAKLTSDKITNYTCNSLRRVDLKASISYGDDIDHAKRVIADVIDQVDGIVEEPAPDIFVGEMAESSIDFVVRPWCKPEDYRKVYFAVTEGIKKRFDGEQISIPFPQRDVHLYDHKE